MSLSQNNSDEDVVEVPSQPIMKPLGESDADPSPKEIFNAIVNLSNSHNKLSFDVTKFQLETSTFIKNNKVNIEKIPQIICDQNQLVEKVNSIEKRLEYFQQKSNIKNVIISGIPHCVPELLPRIFSKVVKALLGPAEVIPTEFITILRDKSGQFNSILVGLSTLKDKVKLMKSKKEKGDLFLEEIGFDVTKVKNARVFLSDHLIAPVYALFREARKLKQNGYLFVWVRGCTVFIQKDKESNKMRINCLDDLKKLEQSSSTA